MLKFLKNFIIYCLVFIAILWFLFLVFNGFNFNDEERWNWQLIDTTQLSFPSHFIWGTADSAFQTEGIQTADEKIICNSWTAWEQEEVLEHPPFLTKAWFLQKIGFAQPQKKMRIDPKDRVAKACCRWAHYKDDMQLLKKIGMNTHRFSIEWSKIEPQNGVIDYAALQHYIDYAQIMIDNNIQPIVTLFHHTLPLWFANKGGFEKTENIQDFVSFALIVFNHFQKAGLLEKTKLWITLNEPIGYALSAYVQGSLPPGKKMHFALAGIVAKNLLDAHCSIYDSFKKIDASIQISFAHAMNPIDPYHPWNPLDVIPAKIFDYLVNDVPLEYFNSGNFYWITTDLVESLQNFSIYSKQFNPHAQAKLDWIGVNYYSHTLLKMFHEASRPAETLADGYPVKKIKAIYPEGFYRVLKKAAAFNLPIIITENGFATTSLELRTEYLKKHLYVLSKAFQEGLDIRGYLFWTLIDCFGWDSGNKSIHGIFSTNPDTQDRTLKSSASYLLKVINDSHKLD